MPGLFPKYPKKIKSLDEIPKDKNVDDIKFGTIGLEEKQYKGDMELLDRYLKFTEEILRLSLLAITGLVSFITLAFKPDGKILDLKNIPYRDLYFVSLACFCIAAAAALFHRFQGVDGFACHIDFLRAKEKNDLVRLWNQGKQRNYRYIIAGKGLILGCILLGAGILMFAAAIICTSTCVK